MPESTQEQTVGLESQSVTSIDDDDDFSTDDDYDFGYDVFND